MKNTTLLLLVLLSPFLAITQDRSQKRIINPEHTVATSKAGPVFIPLETRAAYDSINRNISTTPLPNVQEVLNQEGRAAGTNNLAYPIIYVHGLTGNASTWDEMETFFAPALGLSTDLKFCLNYDLNDNSSAADNDVESFIPLNLAASNFYTINFNCNSTGVCHNYEEAPSLLLSNQAAITKQGAALGYAIDRVIESTGKEKVVLIGHSMGGLAIREYFQNPEHWYSSSSHRIAKVVTTGTPHVGSSLDLFGLGGTLAGLQGIDGDSEAVRDLSNVHDYNNILLGIFQENPGVFIWGGLESQSYMLEDDFPWYNVDVNCNGNINNNIQGINQRNLYTDVEFASIWEIDDIVVSSSNITFNFPNEFTGGEDLCSCIFAGWNIVDELNCESWGIDTFDWLGPFSDESFGHNTLPEITNMNAWALDEADDYDMAYTIYENTPYAGFITPQASNGPYTMDWDDYVISIPGEGELFLSASFLDISFNQGMSIYEVSTGTYLSFLDFVGANEQISAQVEAGDYIIEFNGEVPSGTSFSQYFFQVNFDPAPIAGCTDTDACNYDPSAEMNNNTCTYPGCTDPTACDFDPAAGCNGTCTYPDEIFLDCFGNCINDSNSNGFCDEQEGCLDAGACNYNSDYLFDDGSCEYETCAGCTDPLANNYDPEASIEDGSCDFDCVLADLSYEVIGCGDNSGFFFVEISIENLGTAAPYNAVNTQNNDITTIDELGSSILGPFESSEPVAITLISSSLDNCLGTSPILSCPILSIDEDAEFLFSIYPNPAKDICTLDLGIFWINAQAKLLDAQGKQVMELTIDSQQTELNLSALAAGNYQVILEKGKQRILHRLVVQ
jgi:pimeloyl-ACP methyl ester carboxylesterase